MKAGSCEGTSTNSLVVSPTVNKLRLATRSVCWSLHHCETADAALKAAVDSCEKAYVGGKTEHNT